MPDTDNILIGYEIDETTGFLVKKFEKNSGENVFLPKHKNSFLKALKTHGNQSKAAHDLGFPYSEIQFHLQKDKVFQEAFTQTLLEMRHKLEGELYRAGLGGKSREAKIWLEAHFPAEYKASNKPLAKKDKKDSTIDDLYDKSL
jgi:hypothetical protein